MGSSAILDVKAILEGPTMTGEAFAALGRIAIYGGSLADESTADLELILAYTGHLFSTLEGTELDDVRREASVLNNSITNYLLDRERQDGGGG